MRAFVRELNLGTLIRVAFVQDILPGWMLEVVDWNDSLLEVLSEREKEDSESSLNDDAESKALLDEP
jgi:hypothetical protein